MITFPYLLEQGLTVAAMSGVQEGDCGLHVEAQSNRAAFLASAGADPAQTAHVRQVHGNAVLRADQPDNAALGEADGLVTNVPGLALLVSVADCVPVFLYCPQPRALALLHSGRESTYRNITAAGVRAMRQHFGCLPGHLHAVLGPCISVKNYEVSEEIVERFREARYLIGSRHLDLPQIIRFQLFAAGLPASNIVMSPSCTFENPDFFSYRRDGTKARNLAVGML